MIETNLNETISNNNLKNLFKFITIIITITIMLFIIKALKLGIFEDKTILINYIEQAGILAPIFFIILQLSQVIIPIIPGGMSCVAGVLAFGPITGFIYNYIGIIIGSIIAYHLSKKYGLKIIEKFFPKETITKYQSYIKTNTFNKIFLIGILFPGFPDDLLCYIAGISSMKFKTFLTIILLGKPLSLTMYSFFIHLL
ncbi:MAG: TVP38/TMEM64 family protein [Bacilli bacterium]|nr:TVP38/TMEM64 family protein [Bacilli bacterium]